jgi:hypothetical protein
VIVHTDYKMTERISVIVVNGGNRHTVSLVSVTLNRVYRLVFVPSVTNQRAIIIVWKIWKYVTLKHIAFTFAPPFAITLTVGSQMVSPRYK